MPTTARSKLQPGDAFRAAFATGPMRHCNRCKRLRSTTNGKSKVHNLPDGQPCPTSSQPVKRPDPLPAVRPDLSAD